MGSKEFKIDEIVKEFGEILKLTERLLGVASAGIDKDNLKGEKSFMSWFRSSFVSIPFYLTVALSLTILYFRFIHGIKVDEYKYLKFYAYTFEALIMFLVLIKLASGTHNYYQTDNPVLSRGMQATRTFLQYWTGLWVSWFFLYAILAIFKYDEAFTYGDAIMPKYFFDSVIDACNNLSGVLFFSMYFELAKDTQDTIKIGQTQPWLIGLIFVFIFFVVEFLCLRSNYFQNNGQITENLRFLFSLAFGLLIGVLTGLFVGRLESIIFNIPPFFIVYLTLFAVVQPTFAFLEAPGHQFDSLSLVLFIIALYGKVFLLIVVHWMKETDRLLYYMVRRYKIFLQETKGNYRLVFLTMIDKLNNEENNEPADDEDAAVIR